MTQLRVNLCLVGQYNANASTLESIKISGRTFECFRDYYHAARLGAPACARGLSIMVREPGKRCEFFGGPMFYVPSNRYPAGAQAFKRNSKGERALSQWMAAMVEKYCR